MPSENLKKSAENLGKKAHESIEKAKELLNSGELKGKVQEKFGELGNKAQQLGAKAKDMLNSGQLGEKANEMKDKAKHLLGGAKENLSADKIKTMNKKVLGGICAAVVVLLALVFVFMGEASEIKRVKNEQFLLDKSLTMESLFSNYKCTEPGEWALIKTEKGQTVVQYRAKYKNEKIVESSIALGDKILIPKVAKMLDNEDFGVYLVAQFTFSANKNTFEANYLGKEFNGVTIPQRMTLKDVVNSYKIIQNDRLISIFPNEASRILKYYFDKCNLQSIKNIEFLHFNNFNILNNEIKSRFNPSNNFQLDSELIDARNRCRLATLAKLHDIKFDDKKREVIAKVDEYIIDITQQDLFTAEVKGSSSLYDYESFLEKIGNKYSILQSKSYDAVAKTRYSDYDFSYHGSGGTTYVEFSDVNGKERKDGGVDLGNDHISMTFPDLRVNVKKDISLNINSSWKNYNDAVKECYIKKIEEYLASKQ